MLGRIEGAFRLSNRSLYADSITVGQAPDDNRPAFMWGCGVELTALVAGARLDRNTWETPLRRNVEALDTYRTEVNGITGYDVKPNSNSPDRYYDDNEWLELAYCDVYDLLPEAQYRDRAILTLKFILSGEDDKLGGGIYWHEQERNSKNTCSNGPAVVGALRLCQITGDKSYLAVARRLYDWTNAHLQDADGLYFDNIKLDGRVEKTKWSYNTALMLRANCLFYALTHEQKYLAEAQRIAHAAVARWVKPDTGAIDDGGAFAHLLCEAWLALYDQDHDPLWLNTVQHGLAFLHDKARDPNGYYAEKWSAVQTTALTKVSLLSQASVARAFLFAARYPTSKP
jgi:rhamnogalacturonyl hydrolase YesR